jgi:tRNA dimethylallyltransferase
MDDLPWPVFHAMKSTKNLNDKHILVIVGPTASGKTELGMAMAERINGEIISADSRQIYRYLDAGTAKPTIAQRKLIPHHIVDFLDPGATFDAGSFVSMARSAVEQIQQRNKQVLLVGGTGFYIKSFIDGLAPLPSRNEEIRKELNAVIEEHGLPTLYQRLKTADPETAQKIDEHNPSRVIRAMEVFLLTGKGLAYHHQKTEKPGYQVIMRGLSLPKDDLLKRIEHRVNIMLATGMIEETQGLLTRGYQDTCPAFLSLGYRQVIQYLKSKINKEELKKSIITDTWQYAKRQMTWFKKDKRIIYIQEPFSIKTLEKTLNK